MQTLFNIETDYLAIMDQIEAAEGEITDEMDQALTINKMDLEAKTTGYLEFIGHQEAFTQRIDTEIKRLQQLKKTNTNLITRLKDKLLDAVKLFGGYQCGLHVIGTRSSQSVEIVDLEAVPKDYKIIKVTTQADKAKIKAAIKDGETVPGAQLNNNLNLKIK